MKRNTAGDTLVDVLAPLLLTGLALAGWASTYDGNRWLLAGLGGAAVAGLLAWWLARHGWGPDVLFVLLIPLYAPQRRADRRDPAEWPARPGPDHRHPELLDRPRRQPSAPGVRRRAAAAAVRRGAARRAASRPAWRCAAAARQHPCSRLCSASGRAGARRTEPAWALGLALRDHRGRLGAGARAAARGRHSPVALLTRLGPGRRSCSGWWRPSPDRSRTGCPVERRRPSWSCGDRVPAYDVSELADTARRVPRFTRQLPGVPGNVHDSPLVTVSGLKPGTRLRFVALDTLRPARRSGRATRRSRIAATTGSCAIGSAVDNPADGEESFVQVEVHKDWNSQWVPIAGALQWFGFDGPGSASRERGFRYNPATATGVMTSGPDRPGRLRVLDRPHRRLATPDLEPYPTTDQNLYDEARFVHVPAHGWAGVETRPMARCSRWRSAEIHRPLQQRRHAEREGQVRSRPRPHPDGPRSSSTAASPATTSSTPPLMAMAASGSGSRPASWWGRSCRRAGSSAVATCRPGWSSGSPTAPGAPCPPRRS